MIERGVITEKVEQAVNEITRNLSVDSDQFVWVDDLPHPVAEKGEKVSAKNESQEYLELRPTTTGHPQPVDPEEEISCAGDKEYLADFVGKNSALPCC